jgi:hypothetical protein
MSVTVATGVYVVSGLGDHSVEAIVFICGVVHCAYRAIWFHEAVLSLDDVSVSLFMLALHVSGVVVVNGVLEAVLGVSLSHKKYIFRN